MTESSRGTPGTADSSENTYREVPLGEHQAHGGRPASWVLVAVVIVAFCVGGVAVIEQWWWLFWTAAGVVALAFPAGKLIGIMKDTVTIEAGPRTRAAITGRDSAADPGVRLD